MPLTSGCGKSPGHTVLASGPPLIQRVSLSEALLWSSRVPREKHSRPRALGSETELPSFPPRSIRELSQGLLPYFCHTERPHKGTDETQMGGDTTISSVSRSSSHTLVSSSYSILSSLHPQGHSVSHHLAFLCP